MKLVRLLATIFMLGIVLMLSGGAALANHGGPHWYRGIEIPPLMHGQVQPMSNAFTVIMTLADTMAADPAYANNPAMADIKELMDYARTERTASWYGMVPFSLSSDLSPFHLPAHASLATAHEVLVRLNALPNARAAHALYGILDEAMVRNGASMVGCYYSGTAFSTLEFNTPDYSRMVQSHDLFVGFALLLGLMVAGLSLWWAVRHPSRQSPAMPHQLA